MSNGQKFWLVVGAISFCGFMVMTFPRSPDDYLIEGKEVWTVPGHRGSIDHLTLDSVPTINGHWNGTLTLTLRSLDGRSDIVSTVHSDDTWGSKITVKGSGGANHPWLRFVVSIPSDMPAGSDLTATVTGSITTPAASENLGFHDINSTVNETYAFHVVDRGSLDQRWARGEMSKIGGLPTWTLLILPFLLVVYWARKIVTRVIR